MRPPPPIVLFPRILAQICEDRVRVVLIAPWPLPCRPDLIRRTLSRATHPNPRPLHWAAWPLSGVRAGEQASRLVR